MSSINFKFTDSVVVVTGGASGIGHEMTKKFLEAGAKVVVWDYSEKALESLQAEFSAYSGKLYVQRVDVGSRESVTAAVGALPGAIDILINNAGITRDKSFAKMTPEDWDAVINTNLTGLFNVTKGLLESFNANSIQKRIINISSVVGLYGNFGQTNYAAAKAGVIGMTKTWGKELGRKGFTVNAIAPGFIRTAMTSAMPKDVIDQMSAKVPVARLGEVQDIANTVMFLASKEAGYINATVVSVDGGITL